MSTNTRRFTTIHSFLGRIGDSFKHAWGMVKPGPLAWKGAGLGLLVVSVFSGLTTVYHTYLAQPRVVDFLKGSVYFIAIAANF